MIISKDSLVSKYVKIYKSIK